MICRKATSALLDANFLSPWCQSPSFRAQNRGFCALLPASFFPMAPSASSKPHSAEKSTPVWLAIWRTCAGFANSQHRDAAYAASNNICAHFPSLPHRVAAQTDANLSAHLHRLPTPPPYLRRMRLSHGRGRRYRVLDEAVASQGRRRRMANAAAGCSWRSSCKSPRTLPKCKCLITKQLTFIAVRGGINLSSPSTVLKVNYLFISYLCF